MTQARYIAPDSMVMVTRRTIERRFLLKPTRWMRALFMYLLAWACWRADVKLVGAHCASNHYHVILYDPLGRAPKFARLFNGMMTRSVNAQRNEKHVSLWDNRKTHICRIEDEEALLDKLAYVGAQAVQDGVVPRSNMWTGARTRPNQLGRTWQRLRPKLRLFSKRSKMPEKVELEKVIPPMLQHWDRKALIAELDRRIEEKERAAREVMTAEGRKFLGMGKARATKTTQRATKREKVGTDVRIPRFIASTAAGWKAAHQRLKRFQALRREAFDALRRGAAEIMFPHGTYKVPLTIGVSMGIWPP